MKLSGATRVGAPDRFVHMSAAPSTAGARGVLGETR